MVAMAIWQVFEAAIGESGPQDKTAIAERVVSGFRAILYLYFAFLAYKVISGANASQSQSQKSSASSMMDSGGGRFLVGFVGVVVIVVAPGTGVETRFRSPTDETSKGVTAPEKVKSDESTSSNVKPAGKAVQFRAEDLLPGLFVEAEFRGSGQRDKNQATTVTVIRPIKVLDSSPAAESAPKR